MDRHITIYTGAAGYELFEEAMENQFGFERIYIGKKVLRILRRIGKIKLSRVSGKYYRLVKK